VAGELTTVKELLPWTFCGVVHFARYLQVSISTGIYYLHGHLQAIKINGIKITIAIVILCLCILMARR
jgi:hypothetical protein